MNKNTFYFSHDSNAHDDEKILCLITDHGFEGYGIYWLLLELMFETPTTKLHHELIRGLSHRYKIDISKLSQVINTSVSLGLFESDKKTFWSNSLRSRKAIWIEKREKQSIGGKAAMQRRWASKKRKPFESISSPKPNSYEGLENEGSDKLLISPYNKVKESKVKESKVKESKVNIYTSVFLSFYEEYPRKVAKPHAYKAWLKIALTENGMLEAIMSGLAKWKKSPDWLKDNGQYIPHPATWLNGRRWEDEIIETPKKANQESPYATGMGEKLKLMKAESEKNG